eukprot:1139780-Rhodomonas_salina.1
MFSRHPFVARCHGIKPPVRTVSDWTACLTWTAWVQPDPVAELMDDDVQKVLKNIKAIARKRNGTSGPEAGGSLPNLADVGSSSTE